MPRKFLRSLRRRRRSRRRSSKKKTTNRQKSKKMRGGVTVRAQDLKTRLPEDMFGEIREMHPLLTPKLTNATIKRAVRDYLNGGARKQRVVTKYGEIRNWDVSMIKPVLYFFIFNTTRKKRWFQLFFTMSFFLAPPRFFIPRSVERLVEGVCVPKHIAHIHHVGHVPLVERLVEGSLKWTYFRFTLEVHSGHCVLRRLPSAGLDPLGPG